MALLRRPVAAGAATRQATPEAVASRLLPMVLEGMEQRGRINVLDTGPGAQGTVDFFSGLNARIYIVDLLSCELIVDPPEQISAGAAAEVFTRYLNLPAGLVFDVCLFWDAFHHLDLVLLEGLSLALSPHVDARTLGYGFGALHAGARAHEPDRHQGREQFRYGILDGTHLQLRPEVLSGRYHAHTQRQITEHFRALTIQRATLLRERRLELLLGAS
ncbi:MAG: hypothetical protein R3E86_18975 [Pseudomonadales bacterium]